MCLALRVISTFFLPVFLECCPKILIRFFGTTSQNPWKQLLDPQIYLDIDSWDQWLGKQYEIEECPGRIPRTPWTP